MQRPKLTEVEFDEHIRACHELLMAMRDGLMEEGKFKEERARLEEELRSFDHLTFGDIDGLRSSMQEYMPQNRVDALLEGIDYGNGSNYEAYFMHSISGDILIIPFKSGLDLTGIRNAARNLSFQDPL